MVVALDLLVLLHALTALLVIIDPIGTALIFNSLTQGQIARVRFLQAFKASIISALLLVLLCSNRCAEKITSISFINKTNKTIVIFSKNEYVDYNDNFLSIGFVMDRTVNQNDNFSHEAI